MNYVVLVKAKPYTRTRRGKLERVKGYSGRSKSGKQVFHGTTAKNIYKILFEGLQPQSYHNFSDAYYERERGKRVFVTKRLSVAQEVAISGERYSSDNSPGVVLKVKVPSEYWNDNYKVDEMLGVPNYMLPEVKPEWIVEITDVKTGKPVTESIDSLLLRRFEKAGKIVYIPVNLKVLKRIFKKEKE